MTDQTEEQTAPERKPDGTPCTAKDAVYEFTADELKALKAEVARRAWNRCRARLYFSEKGFMKEEKLDDYLRAEGYLEHK